jgi:hypothetical protein
MNICSESIRTSASTSPGITSGLAPALCTLERNCDIIYIELNINIRKETTKMPNLNCFTREEKLALLQNKQAHQANAVQVEIKKEVKAEKLHLLQLVAEGKLPLDLALQFVGSM